MVAVKSMKTNAIEQSTAEDEFVREAAANLLFNHNNVVMLVGVVTSGQPKLMVIEFCEHGSMLGLLRKRCETQWPLTVPQRQNMLMHVSKGLAHLASKYFVPHLCPSVYKCPTIFPFYDVVSVPRCVLPCNCRNCWGSKLSHTVNCWGCCLS